MGRIVVSTAAAEGLPWKHLQVYSCAGHLTIPTAKKLSMKSGAIRSEWTKKRVNCHEKNLHFLLINGNTLP